MEDSEKGVSKSKQRNSVHDRSALIDITNDSPIVGLSNGSVETPISSMAKQRSTLCKRTPGSGEALLRRQVKNLLQKVEEEAEISKFSLSSSNGRLCNNLKALLNSPAGLLAPTPANTPQVLNFPAVDDDSELFSFLSQSPIEDQLNISEVVSVTESEKDLISRSLFLDFSEKADSSSESQEKPAPLEDDDASIWSIQVNASTRDGDEDEVIEDDDVDAEYGEDGEGEDSEWLLDELCEGISKISVNGNKKGAKFMGKHTRFVYDSDDELGDEVLRLKGLPTPKGMHIPFQDEERDDDQ